MPPEAAEFYPKNGAGDVPLSVQLLRVTFGERVRATEQFAAHLRPFLVILLIIYIYILL